jgi:hypothetical protein
MSFFRPGNFRSMRLLNLICRGAVMAAVVGCGMAQTQVDLRTQTKSVDFSAATSTKPMQTGTSLPATCSIGAMFLNSSAPAGQNVYACTAVNAWTLQGGATPSPAGNTNKVLSNNGSTLQWQAIGGDTSGSPAAVTVTGIQGRGVSATMPAAGQVLTWNAALAQWTPNAPAAVGGAYSSSFTSQTSVTIAGTAHQLNSANLLVTCFDTQIPAMEVEPNTISVNAATFDVTVTFAAAQSGRCVVSSGGGGSGGTNLGSANTYSAGAKQTMAASASTAGLSLTPGALPTNAAAGDMAVDANAGNVLKTFNGSTWSASSSGGGAYGSTFTSQTSVTIAGTAHQLNTPNLVVNCYDTATPAMEVDPNTVSVNLNTYDVTINFAQPQSGRCVVSSGGAASAGGSGTGPTMAAQLGDFGLVSSSSTILTLGGNCSAATPCNVRLGNLAYSFKNSATVTLTNGTGTAYFYVDVNGQLTVGHNLGLTCTGCTAVPGITGFPPNAVPLFTWLATNSMWYSGGPTDYRAFLGSQNLTAGTGISVTNSGSTMLVGVDTAVVPTYVTASAMLTFPSIAAGACATDQTFPLLGATPGDAVAPGWPANLPTGLFGTMWVSANGTLSVRLCNLSAVTVSAASNTYTAADVRSF